MRHDAPGDVAVPRLTLVTTRTISAPVGCHHCAEAPCVDACPTGCLFSDDEYSVREALANGDDEAVRATYLAAVGHKPQKHTTNDGTERFMSQIGG